MKKTLFSSYSRNLKICKAKRTSTTYSLNKTETATTKLNVGTHILNLLSKDTAKCKSINYNINYHTDKPVATSELLEKHQTINQTLNTINSKNSLNPSYTASKNEVNGSKTYFSVAEKNQIKTSEKGVRKPCGVGAKKEIYSQRKEDETLAIDQILASYRKLGLAKKTNQITYYNEVHEIYKNGLMNIENKKVKEVIFNLLREFKEMLDLVIPKIANSQQYTDGISKSGGAPQNLKLSKAVNQTITKLDIGNSKASDSKSIANNKKPAEYVNLNTEPSLSFKYSTKVSKLGKSLDLSKQLKLNGKGKEVGSKQQNHKVQNHLTEQSYSSYVNLTTIDAKPTKTTKLMETQLQKLNTSLHLNISKTNGRYSQALTIQNSDSKRQEINKNLINDLEAMYFEDKVNVRSNSSYVDYIPRLKFEFGIS